MAAWESLKLTTSNKQNDTAKHEKKKNKNKEA